MIAPHQQPQWPPASSLRAPQLRRSPDTLAWAEGRPQRPRRVLGW